MTTNGFNDRGLFSPTALGFLIASVVAVFALSVLLATMSSEETPFGARLDSASAIGHKGFYALLERLDLPVAKSRINGRAVTGRDGLLIVDEPNRDLISLAPNTDLARARTVLLILPKWSGLPDLFHNGWVSKVEPLGIDVPGKIVKLLDQSARIVRGPAPAAWSINKVGAAPKFDGEVQLIDQSDLRPLIAVGDRILLGEFVSLRQRIWILADPDPLENHGLAIPDNARFALTLIDRLRRANGRIVFDETVHGVAAPDRNLIQVLFRFPFVVVTVQIIAALTLLLLATTARFGGAEEPPPPFALGKARLIDNIASLMDRAGHQAIILRRYISVKLTEAARALHAPQGLDDGALAGWLDRIGGSRGIALKASAILAASGATKGRRAKALPGLFHEAQDMYRLSQDLLQKDARDGTGGRQDDR